MKTPTQILLALIVLTAVSPAPAAILSVSNGGNPWTASNAPGSFLDVVVTYSKESDPALFGMTLELQITPISVSGSALPMFTAIDATGWTSLFSGYNLVFAGADTFGLIKSDDSRVATDAFYDLLPPAPQNTAGQEGAFALVRLDTAGASPGTYDLSIVPWSDQIDPISDEFDYEHATELIKPDFSIIVAPTGLTIENGSVDITGVAPIPEPSALIQCLGLLALGAFGLVRSRRAARA